jgi:hypothetical protein
MQRLPNIPSDRATKGGVCTTFGGETDTPIVSLRAWPLQFAGNGGATPALNVAG